MTLPFLCVNYDAPPMSVTTLMSRHHLVNLKCSGSIWGMRFYLGGGIVASIIMGNHAYCEPRKYNQDINDYTRVEVAFMEESSGEWVNIVQLLEKQFDESELSNKIKGMFESSEYYLCPYAQIVDIHMLFTLIEEFQNEEI